MRRRLESGFSVIEVLVVLFAAAILIMVGTWAFTRMKTAHKLQKVTKHEEFDDAKPVLQNLGGIYLAAYNKSTGRAGDITFDNRLVDPTKSIEVQTYLFGQKMVHAGQPDRINPNLDFRGIYTQIDILAAINGKVLFIKDQPGSNDHEIVIAGSDNSTWHIGYDHVVEPRVKRGDVVVAGQVIGKASPYKNGTYYYELQVNHKNSPLGDTLEYACPTTLLDSSVKAAYVEGINLMVRDWITFRTTDAYGPQDGGCVKPSLKAQEVDG